MFRHPSISNRFEFRRSRIKQAIESLEQRTLFAAGDLDPGFSSDGRAEAYDTSPLRTAFQVEIVSGNKTLIAGVSQGELMVQRLKTDGTPDTTFGNSPEGRAIILKAGTAQEMAVRADGKIVLATFYYKPNGDGYTTQVMNLVRLNSNGSVDTTFGGGDGIVEVSPLDGGAFSPMGLTILPNNKLVLAINTQHEMVAARFNADGTPDETFGGDGYAIIDTGGIEFSEALLVAPDGSVFVGGASSESGSGNGPLRSTLVKFKPDGSGVDPAFGSGVLFNTLNVNTGDTSDGTALAFAPNGKLYFGGRAGDAIGVAKIDAVTGAYDNSFSGDGRISISTNGGEYPDLAVQADGKLIVAAAGFKLQAPTGVDFFVYRFKTDGTPDSAWNNGAPATVDFYQGDESPNDIAIQSDGKVVVTGFVRSPALREAFQNSATVRFTTAGKLDTGFSGDGKAGADFPGVIREGAAVAVQGDGKTIVGGTWSGASAASAVGVTQDFFLTRYNVNGTLDTSFGTGGTVQRDVFYGQFDVLKDILIQSNGKILAVGSTAGYGRDGDIALARFNANGTVDTSFGGGDGKVSLGLGGADVGLELAIRPDGKILVSAMSDRTDGSKLFALVRFAADGVLDSTFQDSGIRYHDYGTQLVVTPDSKYLLARQDTQNNVEGVVVTRLNSNGSLDTTYGTGGRTLLTKLNAPGVRLVGVRDLVLQNGKAVVLAEGYVNGDRFEGDRHFASALFRFNTNGTIDSTFGGGDGSEFYVADVNVADDENPVSVVVDSQNRIIIAATAIEPFGSDGNADLAVIRTTANGQLDSSFGTGGRSYADFNQPGFAYDEGSDELGRDVAVLSDGRIVALAKMDRVGGYGVARFSGATTTPPAPTPSLSIADANTFEGNSGTKLVNVTVSLSSATSKSVTVNYRTKNQTAGEGDYGVATGSISFAPGQTSKIISIVIKGDTKVESDETFRIELFENLNATLADGVGVLTIKNDD